MWTVSVEVTSVTAKLNRIETGKISELPVVCWTSLFDVVNVTEPLEMLVCFAVQLEVGLEICLVVTELAQVVASNDY